MDYLPSSPLPYTDKYFTRSRQILEKENLNPIVTLRVFHRRTACTQDFNYFLDIFQKFGGDNIEVWTTKERSKTLAIVKGPVQDLIELETMYLGALWYNLNLDLGIEIHTEGIKEYLGKIPYLCPTIIYMGARHYPWQWQSSIGRTLMGIVTDTSTDVGSSWLNKEGVGTIPHILVLLMAYKYGREVATLKAIEKFHEYMSPEIPRVALVDTFNKELTDTKMVLDFFKERDITNGAIRLDTCGENVGEGCKGLSLLNKHKDGKGVTIELVRKVRMLMVKEGMADKVGLVVTSGMGNTEKAKIFMDANVEFQNNTGYPLFTTVGIGEVIPGNFATSDLVSIEDQQFAKTGRDYLVDYREFERAL